MTNALEWFANNASVKVHKALSVKRSSINDLSSGLGLFVNRASINLEEAQGRDTIELLRIPRSSTISIYSINQIISDKSQYSSEEECNRTLKRVKLANGEFLATDHVQDIASESIFLVFYFLVLLLIQGEYEIPKLLKYYMQTVLSTTKVRSTFLCNDSMEPLYEHYHSCKFFENVFGLLDSYFEKSFEQTPCSIAMIRQMFAIVSSRILEIPKEISPNSENFTTETTLVPLLDFANHDNILRNAHFDIDRGTKDILLLLDLPECKDNQKDEFEVFISYSPMEDMMKYRGVYGFVPETNDGSQYLNIPIERNYLRANPFMNVNMRLFYKWLAINPLIQVIRYEEKWYINDTGSEFHSFLLPFACIKEIPDRTCWEYDDQSYKTFAFFHQHSEGVESNIPELLQTYAAKIALCENNEYDYIELPPLAWTLSLKDDDGVIVRGRFTKEEALEITPLNDQDVFESAITSFSEYFVKYLNWRLERLIQAESKTDKESPLMDMLQTEIKVLKRITEGDSLLFWTDLKPETQSTSLSYPRPPLWNPTIIFTRDSTSLEQPQMPNLHGLSLHEYNPKDHTDFLDDELGKYADFYK